MNELLTAALAVELSQSPKIVELVFGRDALAPGSWDYPHEFPFSGELERVSFEISDDAEEVAHEVFD